jgi:magnesium transporter
MTVSAAETAALSMVRDVPTVRADVSCGAALEALRARRHEYAECIVALDEMARVLGVASVGRAAACAPESPLLEIIERSAPRVSAETDQERVASLAIASPLAIVLVVDEQQRLLGVVPPRRLLSILRHEHVEDLLRLAGVSREAAAAREAIEAPLTRRVRHRLPWLLVGLAGSIVAALVMAQFEMMLSERVTIAFFVPGIVYLADAIGTQTEAIAVRGLSLSHQRISQLLASELFTGLLIGVVLGALAFLGVWATIDDFRLALAVGGSLVAAGGIATAIGLVLPWGFQRMGFDPAYGSGPLATVVQDVLSLLVYFTSVGLLL